MGDHLSKNAWKDKGREVLAPVVSLLANLGVTPTAVTLFGLGLHVLGAVVIGFGSLAGGGIILVLAAICDALDGALARETGQTSRFGAFLDSTIDRVDETVVFAGIAAYYLSSLSAWGDVWAVVALLALAGSLITSYARARAEGLGLDCSVGVFERPERIVVTLLGLFLGTVALALALLVLVVFSWFTVYQRIEHVRSILDVGGPSSVDVEADSDAENEADPPPVLRNPAASQSPGKQEPPFPPFRHDPPT
jgi:CDP-diacylglycerol--glycerol-3-phosphate 3-phosphatidyltransferase